MPAPFFRTGPAKKLSALLASMTLAQAAFALDPLPTSADNSTLDAQLMYQLLIGEMELRTGDAGTAYEVMLDAARRSKDEQLFRRATDIALEARAGDQALAAVKAWRSAIPGSLEALRFHLQLLVALNRVPEAAEPLKTLLNLTPASQRATSIAALPRLFSRSAEPKQAATLLEQALQPYVDGPDTGTSARVAIGRAWLAAQDPAKALEFAQRAQAREGAAEGPAFLALELLPGTAEAEAIVMSQLGGALPDGLAVVVGGSACWLFNRQAMRAAVPPATRTIMATRATMSTRTVSAMTRQRSARRNYLLTSGGKPTAPTSPCVSVSQAM